LIKSDPNFRSIFQKDKRAVLPTGCTTHAGIFLCAIFGIFRQIPAKKRTRYARAAFGTLVRHFTRIKPKIHTVARKREIAQCKKVFGN